MIATFMAKWSMDFPGQIGHMHLSLYDLKTGAPVFHDADQPYGMSEFMRHNIAGVEKYLKSFLVMSAPTINSYTRLTKGAWAPTSATWGIDNRTSALRIIPGSEKSQRVEFRIGAADANPYIIFAAALASGLWGIEQKLEPESKVTGNAYDQTFPQHLQLPATLWDAAQRLKGSDVARELFGNEFVDHYAASREWEEREFRKHITDWEIERYFEII